MESAVAPIAATSRRPHGNGALALVLRAVLRHGPVSQQGLARRTRLHQATVSRALTELKRRGLVVEAGDVDARPGLALEAGDGDARLGRGRRPAVVDLDRARTAVLGIQLGVSRAYVGLVDLRGRLIDQSSVPLGPDPAAGVERALRAGAELVRGSLPPTGTLLGVGIGAAGLADIDRGTVHFGPDDAAGVPVVGLAEGAFGVTVFLSTNVHAMALAEAWYGVGSGVASVALLLVARVVRFALVIEGRIYHGVGPHDGMLGHAVMDPDGPPCACGQRGCLEVLTSETRVETEAALLAEALPDSTLARELAADGLDVYEAVVRAARAGDAGAESLLLSRARWLARGIAFVRALLNPSTVLVAGPPAFALDDELARIRGELERLAPRMGQADTVVASSLPFPDIAMVGAATLVLEAFFAPDGRWAAAEERAARRRPSLDVTA